MGMILVIHGREMPPVRCKVNKVNQAGGVNDYQIWALERFLQSQGRWSITQGSKA
jgi:hypothetical protein